ncbi:MAG: DUF547 domain-containing protein [Pseudomonadales bacterium]
MFKRFICMFFLAVIAYPAMATSHEDYQTALASWSRTLQLYVDERGRTDFRALASDSDDLSQFVSFVESTSPASHPDLFATEDEVLAYHINAYNALAMYGVISEDIPSDFDGFFKRLSFFKLRSVVIGGEKTSLYDYENKVIRPLDEPRVHFALNCMVRDCPRLPQEAFQANTLEQQLEVAAQEFFNKDKHIRIDADKRTLYVSKILDFYTEDFVPSGKVRDLTEYVNRYAKMMVPEDYRVKFIDYNWTINQQPAALTKSEAVTIDKYSISEPG